MQVSQIAELDTHAVIGGAKAKAFFMSDSAEFFTILSDTLYRDKKLAVVREVACNAWDAHTLVGKTDLPIEITLTDEELIIKDFGPGIADAKMHPTYCGYGVSTKVKDDTQTGGFGLGCKAPFAYSDHFTVTSCHEGWRSVYAISRGGVDTEGKPGLIRMIKVKSDETGITVSIPIKDRNDQAEFHRLIKRVVRQGGIKAKLNDAELPTYDLEAIDKTGYGLVFDHTLSESAVYVRYGAVLYPLSTEDPTLSKMARAFQSGTDMTLILSALPGSVGVTPSREALSYSEKTVATLKGMLERVTNEITANRDRAVRVLADRIIAARTDKFVPGDMNWSNHEFKPAFCADPFEVAVNVVRTAIETRYYDSLANFRSTDTIRRKALIKAAMRKHRDDRRVFRRLAGCSNGNMERFRTGSGGHVPDTTRLLIRMASRLGILKQISRFGGAKEWDDGCERTKYGVHSLTKCATPFTDKPKLVLVRGREQASGYLSRLSHDHRSKTAFITVRNMKPARIEEIKAAAKAYKFELEVLDIAPPERKPRKPKVEAPKEKFHALAAARGEHRIDISQPLIDHAPYYLDMHSLTVNPDMYKPDVRNVLKQHRAITAVYPKVALAHGPAQKKALEKAGSRPITEVIAEDLLALKDTPETIFAIMASKGLIVPTDHGRSPTELACDLAESDMRYAKLLTGQKMVVSAEERRIHRLFKLFGSVRLSNDKVWNHVSALVAKVKPVLKKTDVAYLKPLASFWGYQHNRELLDPFDFDEDLVEMIRFLQKRTRKSVVNFQRQPMKEAA
ncbi:ATP-binding protein [Mesorhizobium sp.]|uniref:ATP-binding protein n=1 Tax=Mesorhizobium sp. TaxID=1871066 RepID=UPI0025809E43|nr:ATP-binding protein [Mesorhizobium sp.]